MKNVKVGKRVIPVMEGRTVAVFSAGRAGPSEKGIYHFWTAVCIDKKRTKEICGRNLIKLDAGERFRRIGKETKSASTAAVRRAYKKSWTVLQGIVYVRPTTVMEASRWLATHEEDAIYLKSLKFL